MSKGHALQDTLPPYSSFAMDRRLILRKPGTIERAELDEKIPDIQDAVDQSIVAMAGRGARATVALPAKQYAHLMQWLVGLVQESTTLDNVPVPFDVPTLDKAGPVHVFDLYGHVTAALICADAGLDMSQLTVDGDDHGDTTGND